MTITNESKGRVLFVNNDTGTDEIITLIFKDAGYQTVIARSINVGMKLVSEEPFDLFLIDWLYVDGTGIDLCHSIRQVDEYTPILFFIAETPAVKLTEVLRAGGQGCLINSLDINGSLNAQ
jgi:DNA-binding response OmpR family regulator